VLVDTHKQTSCAYSKLKLAHHDHLLTDSQNVPACVIAGAVAVWRQELGCPQSPQPRALQSPQRMLRLWVLFRIRTWLRCWRQRGRNEWAQLLPVAWPVWIVQDAASD